MKRLVTITILFLIFAGISSLAGEQGKDFKVDVILDSTTTLGDSPIVLPQGENVKIESHLVEIKPGAEIGRHKHPYPVYMYVLEGTLLVVFDDGTEQTYKSGEAFIEGADTWVNNKNAGSETVKFLAVLPGFKDAPVVVMPEND